MAPKTTPEHPHSVSKEIDPFIHAAWAKACSSLSPESLAQAWFDWGMHMTTSPGKSADLAMLAMMQATQIADYLHAYARAPSPAKAAQIEPPKTDPRFSDPLWREWPYNVMHQAFLHSQEWWDEATHGTWGVSRHHEDAIAFSARQLLELLSPSNSFYTNPVVLRRTTEEGGANLVRGAINAMSAVRRKINEEPPEGAENYVVGRNVGITPGKVIMRNQLAELIQYTPTTDKVRPEPILIVPAWIMKYYILDLSPENSMVRYLVSQGYTVFCISWVNPGKSERDMDMEDYLNMGIYQSLDAINSVVPHNKIHATGYCLGGTLLSIAAAAMSRDNDERLASITMLAAQTDFTEPGDLGLFIDEGQLSMMEAQMSQTGHLDGSQMAGAFQLLRSYDLMWEPAIKEYMLGEAPFMNDLMAWNADATRMPAKMHSRYLRSMYLNDDLSEGRYKAKGKPVSLSDISLPVFCVGTVKDHVAPWRSVYKLHYLVPGELTFVLTSGGHNAGIVSEPGHPRRSYQIMARKKNGKYIAPEDWLVKAAKREGSWWEEWVDWLNKRSGAPVAAPRMGSKQFPPIGDAPGKYVLVR